MIAVLGAVSGDSVILTGLVVGLIIGTLARAMISQRYTITKTSESASAVSHVSSNWTGRV